MEKQKEKTKVDKSKQNQKHFKCYRCSSLIHVPQDYKGNPYILLQDHYMIQHNIDLMKDGWLSDVQKVIDNQD
jgi:hypothetical protein